MSEKKCQAVAKATGTQCEKRVLLGATYCWFHTPKKEPFIFLIFGALLGLGFQTLYDIYTISPEESLITKLQTQIYSYQDSIEKKDSRIAELENTTNSILGYSYVARLDIRGTTGVAGRGLTETTPISKLMKHALVEEKGKLLVKCDTKSTETYYQVISKFPRFPFSYYALAVCLHKQKDDSWKEYAMKAIEILDNTTILSDHNQNHEEALKELKGLLKTNIHLSRNIGAKP